MGVSARRLSVFVALLLVLALTVPALANTVRTTITLISPVKLAGTRLKPGDYELVADEAKVTVKHNGKIVCECKAEWAEAKSKTQATSLILDGDEVREIRFGGKTRYLLFR